MCNNRVAWTFARRIGAFLGLALAVSLLGGGVAVAAQISSPSSFKDDFDSRMASDGESLWFGVTGLDGANEMRTEVFTYRNGKWAALPGRPLSTTQTALLLVARKSLGNQSIPCVGRTTRKNEPLIQCFQRGHWRSKPISKSLRNMALVGMNCDGRRLIALFSDREGRSTKVKVAQLTDGQLRQKGSALKLAGGAIVATLGDKTRRSRSTNVDVGLENIVARQRWVATLHAGVWSRSLSLPQIEPGPQASGPVRAGHSIFFPVVNTGAENWPFFLYHRKGGGRWSQVGGGALSDKTGKAQGVVDPAGNDVWAAWGQHGKFANDGLAPTSVHAALVGSEGDHLEREILLWSGRTIGPGPVQVVDYLGEPVFMYSRQFDDGRGLHATVDFSHR